MVFFVFGLLGGMFIGGFLVIALAIITDQDDDPL
jgi:hypothetical protein